VLRFAQASRYPPYQTCHRRFQLRQRSGRLECSLQHHALDQLGVLEPGLAFIEKPFSSEALVRKIREILTADRAPLF
jgi:hypothetical protein